MTVSSILDSSLASYDINGIKEMIPHRYPFLLIDKVINITPNVSCIGIKNVTNNEPFFAGHFPNHPVMPGVLIVESMAQTSAVLVVHTLGEEAKGKVVYFMSVEEAKFRKPVIPGDVLHIHCEVDRSRGAVWKFKAKATVDGTVVAEACFAAMIMNEKGV